MSDKPKVWEPKNPVNQFVFKCLTQKQLPPNYDALENAVHDLINIMTQTDGGDWRGSKKTSYSLSQDYDVIVLTILLETCAFVLSGDIEKVREDK